MDFWTALKGLKAVGFGPAFKGLLFTFKKKSLERRFSNQGKPIVPDGPGALVKVHRKDPDFRFEFEKAILRIEFIEPGIPVVTWTPGQLPAPGFVLIERRASSVDVERAETSRGWELTTRDGRVVVFPDGTVAWFDSEGEERMRVAPPERGASTHGWLLRHSLPEEGAVYGLGQRTTPLNLRGGAFRLWNSEPRGHYGPGDDPIYMSIPFYSVVSPERIVGVLVDNASESFIGFRREGEIEVRGGAARLVLMTGTLPEIIEIYTRLTGRPAMPPKWSLGYHQCRWSYQNEDEVRELVKGFEDLKLPVSAVHLDIHYMDGYRVFTADPERFPDMKRLSDFLHEKGIRLVTIMDPGVKVDTEYPVYREALEGDHLLKTPDGKVVTGPVWPGTCAFPDFTRKETRRWWGDHYRQVVEWGVDGVWHDMNEPAVFTAWGDSTLPVTVRHDFDGRGGDHTEGHNLFALLENRSAFEGLLRQRPDRRPWIVSRSGWAGNQRYAWNWTGDCESTWWTVHQTVRLALALGLSGIPYTGPDIGGFSGNPDAELYTRWFQLSAFLPFFRTHSAAFVKRREPWSFGEETTNIVRSYLEMRYRLMPYWYTLAREAHRTGAPLVRPLFWNDFSNTDLWEVDDQFLLGDGLLVAPILEPQAASRVVLLPAGLWHPLAGGTALRGDRSVELEVALEEIPVFVRGGTVLPMDNQGRDELHLYPDENGVGKGVRFVDDGDGYGDHRTEHWAFETHPGEGEEEPSAVLSLSVDGDYLPKNTDLHVFVHGTSLLELRFRGNTLDFSEGTCRISLV